MGAVKQDEQLLSLMLCFTPVKLRCEVDSAGASYHCIYVESQERSLLAYCGGRQAIAYHKIVCSPGKVDFYVKLIVRVFLSPYTISMRCLE